RHPFGPRVYVLSRRIHEYHLGLAVLAALAVGSFFDLVDLGLATGLAALVGVWLVAKDWRDLVPSKRDSATWQMGLHRRAAPLRGLRRADSPAARAALAALTAGGGHPRSRGPPPPRRGPRLLPGEPPRASR